MGGTRTLAILILVPLLSTCSHEPSTITVGSKNFVEQVLLGEIAAQHLERRLGYSVKRKLNLGGTLLAHQAILNGNIDLYPEYLGTGAAAVLNLVPSKKCWRAVGTSAPGI